MAMRAGKRMVSFMANGPFGRLKHHPFFLQILFSPAHLRTEKQIPLFLQIWFLPAHLRTEKQIPLFLQMLYLPGHE
jgi:hypothetical protein